MTSYGRGDLDSFGGTSRYQSGSSSASSNDFSRLSSAISSNIQKINQNTKQCQALVYNIGTSNDTSNLTSELQNLQHSCNELVKSTRDQLKNLAESVRNSPAHERRQRDLQKQRLADEFTKSLNNLQKVQREAADKERESVRRARQNSTSTSNPFTDDWGADANLVSVESGQPKQSMQAVIDEEENLAAIQEREEAIKSLERDILDVNDIFKDLGQLVHEQGDMIDSIESNVENASVHVEQAHVQLEQAKDYQSKARRKKFICAAILVAILIIVILAIAIPLAVKNNKKN